MYLLERLLSEQRLCREHHEEPVIQYRAFLVVAQGGKDSDDPFYRARHTAAYVALFLTQRERYALRYLMAPESSQRSYTFTDDEYRGAVNRLKRLLAEC